jgi:predicted RNA-binding Zn-ribbon protein involved in translation (DUF1610 family)
MNLHQFLRMALGFRDYLVASDIDQTIIERAAVQLCDSTGISAEDVTRFTIPARWRCTTWNNETRRHNAQVFVCPECLQEPGAHARKFWRTRVGGACIEHRRWLVGACAKCGETLRFNVTGFGAALAPWLDVWPYCAACGEVIETGDWIPNWLAHWTERWMRGTSSDRRENADVDLTFKVVCQLEGAPKLVTAVARRTGVPASANATAAVAALFMMAFHGQLHFQRSIQGRALFSFFAGMAYDIGAICDALCTVAKESDPNYYEE